MFALIVLIRENHLKVSNGHRYMERTLDQESDNFKQVLILQYHPCLMEITVIMSIYLELGTLLTTFHMLIILNSNLLKLEPAHFSDYVHNFFLSLVEKFYIHYELFHESLYSGSNGSWVNRHLMLARQLIYLVCGKMVTFSA